MASFFTLCACSLIALMYLPLLLAVRLVPDECPIITFSFTTLPGRGVLASATSRFATPHLVGISLASHKRLWMTKKEIKPAREAIQPTSETRSSTIVRRAAAARSLPVLLLSLPLGFRASRRRGAPRRRPYP